MKAYRSYCWWGIFFVMVTSGLIAQESKAGSHIYPKAKEGMEQVIIDLPKVKSETLEYRVEFSVGKDMETDLCNPYTLIGEWIDKQVEDSELVYFIASTKGQVVKAMNPCKNDKVKTQFVGIKSRFLEYKNNQQLVVYVPEGYQLRYRVWNSDKAWKKQLVNSASKTKKTNKAK